jgi:hypothetical protein
MTLLSKRFGLFALGALFMLLAGFASALTLESSADTVIVSGTRADVTFWSTSDLNVQGSLAFSAQVGDFNAYFDRPVVAVSPGETAATHLIIGSPDFFRGVKDVVVRAQLCTPDLSVCNTAAKTVRFVNYPYGQDALPASTVAGASPQTDPYRQVQPNGFVDGFANQNNFLANDIPAYGVRASRVVRTEYANPTERGVDISGDLRISTVATRGARASVRVANNGAAGDYDFVLSGDSARLNAVASISGARLQEGEVASFNIDVYPKGALKAGRYNLVLQVQNAGRLVPGGYANIQVDVTDVHTVELALGVETLEVKRGQQAELPALLTNRGTAAEDLQLLSPDFISHPTSVLVAAGQSRRVVFVVDATNLNPGNYAVEIGGQNQFIAGKGSFTLVVKPADLPAPTVAPQDDLVALELSVTNTGNTTWTNVTASLLGIPEAWTVTKGAPVNLKSGESTKLLLLVNRTTDEEAPNPVLFVKSDGVNVARQDLPKIGSRKSSGLTGLFTAGANSFSVILVLVVLAIIGILMVVRATESGAQSADASENDSGDGNDSARAAAETRSYQEELARLRSMQAAVNGDAAARA